MFTPQQIDEISFDKAVFGGYDMASVDEFLEPLTEDYITLYKENALLKSKMRVLVEKLEEYRRNEASMRDAIVNAQKTCDKMVREAEAKCTKMLNDANAAAAENSSGIDSVNYHRTVCGGGHSDARNGINRLRAAKILILEVKVVALVGKKSTYLGGSLAVGNNAYVDYLALSGYADNDNKAGGIALTLKLNNVAHTALLLLCLGDRSGKGVLSEVNVIKAGSAGHNHEISLVGSRIKSVCNNGSGNRVCHRENTCEHYTDNEKNNNVL